MPQPRRPRISSLPQPHRAGSPPPSGRALWLLPLAALVLVGVFLALKQEPRQPSGDTPSNAARTSPRGSGAGTTIDSGLYLTGVAAIHDGDTMTVNGIRVRLHGIDAPELDQPCRRQGRPWACGRAAKTQLEGLVGASDVACTAIDKDRYGRIVARCSIAGQDIQAWMVRNGWAIAYDRYSKEYLPQQAQAQRDGLGIWQGENVAPESWRRRGGR